MSCTKERGEVISGIPKGSVVGPLVFLIYIWDLNINYIEDPKVMALVLKYVEDTCIISNV